MWKGKAVAFFPSCLPTLVLRITDVMMVRLAYAYAYETREEEEEEEEVVVLYASVVEQHGASRKMDLMRYWFF